MPCAAFLFALLLAACPNPGDTTPGGGTSTGGSGTTPGGGGGTGPLSPARRTGTLGFKLFENPLGVYKNPFDRIFLHEAVFNRYRQEELDEIFGVSTGGKGRYFDINDKDKTNPREFRK